MTRLLLVPAAVLILCNTAMGQAPFVGNLDVPSMPGAGSVSGPTNGYVDILGTDKTFTLPAGKAIITWSMSGSGGCLEFCRYRPAIGNEFPAIGHTGNGDTATGSWVIDIPGGVTNIRLQAEVSAGVNMNYGSAQSASWSIIVFPETAAVPAVGGVSLAVLAILIVGGGAIVMRRRRKFVNGETMAGLR